jgi:hypothetical protein
LIRAENLFACLASASVGFRSSFEGGLDRIAAPIETLDATLDRFECLTLLFQQSLDFIRHVALLAYAAPPAWRLL